MALSFLSGSGSASNAKYFDIRLDDDYVVFRGNEQEASSAHLRGSVVLCLSEPLTVKHLKLTLLGMSRVSWYLPASSRTGSSPRAWKESNFFEKTWSFREAGKGKTEILRADNYEFPFDLILEGSLPESIEGSSETWITYRFKAEIGRKYSKDIQIRKPLRIIRTLDPSALELAHAMSVENVWPNKIEYSISTSSKAVIFGTTVRVDFRLVPLLKGLKIGLLSTELIESHDFTLDPDVLNQNHNNYKTTKTIARDEYQIDEECELEIMGEEAEGFEVSRELDLPKSLQKCLQDTDARGIKIRHKLKFNVQLHNPDGHTSELRATLPVAIFISPNLPIDENNNLVDQSPQTAQRAVSDLSHQAPPLYGEHQFDQLYSDVDCSGYRTPGHPSDPGTPFGTHSRKISSENIASTDALTASDISASVLHSRLTSLHPNGSAGNSPQDTADGAMEYETSLRRLSGQSGDYFSTSDRTSNHHSPGSSDLSRRTSEEDHIPSGAHTPRPQYLEVEDLCRVPSYSTAVRTPVRTPLGGDLPNYQAATRLSTSGPSLEPPRQALLRGGWTVPGPSTFSDSLNLPDRPPMSSQGRSISQLQDEERRLRLMQALARA